MTTKQIIGFCSFQLDGHKRTQERKLLQKQLDGGARVTALLIPWGTDRIRIENLPDYRAPQDGPTWPPSAWLELTLPNGQLWTWSQTMTPTEMQPL